MNTKSLSFGTVFPKIVSVTKIATETNAAPIKSAPKKALVMPRAITNSKPIARRNIFANLVPFATLVSIAAIIAMVGFHLFAVNSYSTKGFELKRHQVAISELTEQQKRLVVQQAEMGSIMKVNDAANKFGLVPISDEEYVTSNQFTQR